MDRRTGRKREERVRDGLIYRGKKWKEVVQIERESLRW